METLALHNLKRELWRKAEKAELPIGKHFLSNPCTTPFSPQLQNPEREKNERRLANEKI